MKFVKNSEPRFPNGTLVTVVNIALHGHIVYIAYSITKDKDTVPANYEKTQS